MRGNSNSFIKQRKNIFVAENLFKKVLQYFVFCFKKQQSDKVKYSRIEIEKIYKGKKTENYLRNRFLFDYLRKNRKQFGDIEIESLYFLPEPGVEYKENNKIGDDLVDIFVLGLPKNCINSKYDREEHYFAFECKRIKSKQTIDNEYLTDITKFINRDYWKTGFRFPFNGMLGFVEHKTPNIPKIIDNLESKLFDENYNTIINQNIRTLQEHKIPDFEYCKISNHKHNNVKNISIKIYHLFFDYSNIIRN